MSAEGNDIEIGRDGTTLPVLEVLTGRGFITGKSGSGKSVSTNVILEGLLDQGHPFLIIDTDGEYWGLKELYQVLHLGAGEQCDVEIDASDAETIVDVALDGHPVILDVSGFLQADEAQELIEAVLTRLFRQEKQRRKPFLLVIEEVHEYIPEQGGLGDVGDILIQIAKRGRKHGLGLVGVSQRPAAVDKDFITQCDWIVWHRLTWKNDTDVVARILGATRADEIQEFKPGEAFLMADWESELKRIRFTMKESYDAGATPGMESPDPPVLKPLDPVILERFDVTQDSITTTTATSDDGPERSGSEDEAVDSDDTSSNDDSNADGTATPGSASSHSSTGQDSQKRTSATPDPRTPNDSPDEVPVAFAVEFTNLCIYAFQRVLTTIGRGFGRLQRWIWGDAATVSADGPGESVSTPDRRAMVVIVVIIALIALMTGMILL